MAAMTVAVIGAGIAGLACARRLASAGWAVSVFDKGRGLGGRMATRRGDGAEFDHGAQHFTVRDDAFAREIDALGRAGVVAEWRARFGVITGSSGITPDPAARLRYVAAPRMTSLCHALAQGIDVRARCVVNAVTRDDHGWRLHIDKAADAGPFDAVLVTIPAPQAAGLIGQVAPGWATALAGCAYAPCLAAMIHYEVPVDLGFDAITWRDGDERLAWAARNNSKPGRSTEAEAWVIHGAPGWSLSQLDRPAAESAEALYTAFTAACAVRSSALDVAGHRWRYARVTQPLGEPSLYDAELGLGLAGDWCLGARVEDAWRSGHSLAGQLMRTA